MVRIDHNNLRYFLEQELKEKQQMCVSKVEAYDFDIMSKVRKFLWLIHFPRDLLLHYVPYLRS